MKNTYPTSDKAKSSHRGPHLTKEAKRRANKSTRRITKPVLGVPYRIEIDPGY